MGSEREIEWSEIDYYGMIKTILKNSWVVILVTIGAVLLTTVYYEASYVPEYTTQATFVVSSKVGSDSSYSNLSTTMSMASVFEELLKSDLMKDAIAKELNWTSVEGTLSTSVIQQTNLMTVQVSAATPEKAYRIIKAFLNCYPTIINTVFSNAVLQVIDYPTVPYGPSNYQDYSGMIKKVKIATAGSIIVLIALLYYFRDTVMTESGAKKQLDSKLLGVINYETKNKTLTTKLKRVNKSVLVTNPVASFIFTETMQKIATKIAYELKHNDCKTIMVTSVQENEGKTTVAANLALSLAMAGNHVLLMDGDFRKPAVYKILAIDKDSFVDYGSVLEEHLPTQEHVTYEPVKKLDLYLCKSSYDNADQLIRCDNMKQLLSECRETFDYVVIDMPPVGFMVDTEEMGNLVDASLLVVRQDKVPAQIINDTIDSLEQRHAKLLGYILNGVNRFTFNQSHSYGYGYGYGYGHAYGTYSKYRKNHKTTHEE